MRGHEAEALGCRQGLNCPYRHSQEEIQIFVDERDLRRRKLLIRCNFCTREECKSEGCCARSLRVAAAVPDADDSDYESADSNDCADGCAGDDSAGFAFACREKELEYGLTEEEWDWTALQRHGGAEGEAEGQIEAVKRQAEAVPGAGAVRGTGEAPSGQTAAMPPQVPDGVTEVVPAPGASVEEQQDWFRSVLQQFEGYEVGGVWKQRRQEWEARGWMQPAV